MIVSVTPNTAIDYSMRVPEFILGRTIRSLESAWGMGGKAADAAWILGKWGDENLALGFAAGDNGRRMEAMLREHGCQTNFVWVNGETRLNTVICMNGRHTTFTSATLEVSSNHIEAFFEVYTQTLERASCVVVGGTLPRGAPSNFFYDVIRMARQKDIPVIFSSSGPYLKDGIGACPTVVKPNLVELMELAGRELPINITNPITIDQRQLIVSLAKQVQSRYKVSLVVTLGDEGAMAIFNEQDYWIPAPKIEVVSAAGAGDAVLAGLAHSYAHNDPIEEGLRLGFALAAANLLTLPTADFRPEDALHFLASIELQPIL